MKSKSRKAISSEDRLSGLEMILVRYRYALSLVAHLALFTLSLLLAYMIRSDAVVESQGYSWTRGLESFLYTLPFFLIGTKPTLS